MLAAKSTPRDLKTSSRPHCWRSASEQLRCDKKLVMAAVADNGRILEPVSEEMREDKEVVQSAVARDGEALAYASRELRRSDKEVGMLLAVSSDSRDALKFASAGLRYNGDVVTKAVPQGGFAFRYAADSLRSDEEFVRLTVSCRRGHALRHASERLRGNEEAVLATINNVDVARAFQYASPKLQGNKKIAMAAVSHWGYCLQHLSEELQNDKEIVMAAVSQAPIALRLASKELRNDKDVVMVAVAKDGSTLKYASATLRSDRDVVLAAVANCPGALYHATSRHKLSVDLDFVARAMRCIDVGKSSQPFAKRLAPFPGLTRRLRELLREIADITNAADRNLSPGSFAEQWTKRLTETQLTLSVAFPNVSDHILEFHGLHQEKELAKQFERYAPVLEVLMRDPLSDDGWLKVVPRFTSWFDEHPMAFHER